MYCSKCGNNNNESCEYCGKCGNKLKMKSSNNLNVVLDKKTYLILSIISFAIPFVMYVLDIILQTPYFYGTKYDFIAAVLLLFVATALSIPSIVLLILNIVSNSKKQNKKGLVIAELIFACVNIYVYGLFWLGFPTEVGITSQIGFILILIVNLLMAVGYIVKLVKRKF